MLSRVFIALSCSVLIGACANSEFDPGQDGGDGGGPCKDGEQRCEGNMHVGCKDGVWLEIETCASPRVCSLTLNRCADCDPGLGSCKGDDLHECTASGTVGARIKTCPPGQCSGGQCVDLCSQAADNRSYIGCEYWPTVTANAVASDFSFAVVVANPQQEDVDVTISSPTNPQLAKETLAPQTVKTIVLPWVTELKEPGTGGFPSIPQSVMTGNGSYKLVSSAPVSAYQFSPLKYVLPGDCVKGQDPTPGDNKCHSYTNDASLLLPIGVLNTDYIVLSWPTSFIKAMNALGLLQNISSPGFFTVVAASPGETKVSLRFAGNTQSGNQISAYKAGQTAQFTMPHGAVLQIISELPPDCSPVKTDEAGEYCDLSASTDLTGTEITSDKPVAVFSGHNCTFVPFDKWACDHLEEQLIPTASWGRRYIGTHPHSSGDDPSIYRVISAKDGNKITFSTDVHPTATVDRGKFIEFVTTKDFQVEGTEKFALVQFMVGQNYSGATAAGAPGDPAMALAVPVEQYRTNYRFLTPESFEQSYVNVIARSTANVKLDNKEVTGFQPITGTDYGVAKVKVNSGVHLIAGSNGFGIAVYGVGSYTSYMYPGGLDLKLLE